MSVCIECKKDVLNCHEIKTKRGSVIYICHECAEKNKKRGRSANNSK